MYHSNLASLMVDVFLYTSLSIDIFKHGRNSE